MFEPPHILTPAGQIVRYLIIKKRATARDIATGNPIALSTVYSNLKDLLIADLAVIEDGKYAVTKEGIRRYLSEVLPDDVDVPRLIKVSEELGIPAIDVVRLGIRLIVDILEAGKIPGDLGHFLADYDPSALDRLTSMLNKKAEAVA